MKTSLPSVATHVDTLRQGRSSATRLVEDALGRIEEHAGEGRRVFTRVYAKSARAAAEASDLLRSAGLSRSPIDGLPISIKDLFDVAGETTQAGSVVLREAAPADEDAIVISRLRSAGAVIVGRTNMTEFAYSGLGINPHYGTPANPWDRANARIPGGSSSGAAVSVSDGMAVAGIGSDTGGSIRIPAALCGLTGFKPTARRVPMVGVLPLATHLDSIGAIAPSVNCCALLDAILAGQAPAPIAPAALAGLRLLIPTTLVLDDLDQAVAAAFQKSLARLAAAGARLVETPVPAFSALASINAAGGFSAAESWAWHRAIVARAAADYDPRVLSRIARGRDFSAADFLDLLRARAAWIAGITPTLSAFDAIVMPTVPVIAPRIADLAASDEAYTRANLLMLRNPSTINFLDGCALSLPCHDAGGAPVGLMIAGTALSDAKILAIGLAVESCLSLP